MSGMNPFTPGNSVLVTVAAASAVIAIPAGGGMQLRVSSLAANAVAYIAFGNASTTVVIPTGTAANGMPILPGSASYFTIPPGATHVATIGTVANTLILTVGDGAA